MFLFSFFFSAFLLCVFNFSSFVCFLFVCFYLGGGGGGGWGLFFCSGFNFF